MLSSLCRGVKKIKTRMHLLCYNNFNQKYIKKGDSRVQYYSTYYRQNGRGNFKNY